MLEIKMYEKGWIAEKLGSESRSTDGRAVAETQQLAEAHTAVAETQSRSFQNNRSPNLEVAIQRPPNLFRLRAELYSSNRNNRNQIFNTTEFQAAKS